MTRRGGKSTVTRRDPRDVLTSTGILIFMGPCHTAARKERDAATHDKVNAPALRVCVYARTKPRDRGCRFIEEGHDATRRGGGGNFL